MGPSGISQESQLRNGDRTRTRSLEARDRLVLVRDRRPRHRSVLSRLMLWALVGERPRSAKIVTKAVPAAHAAFQMVSLALAGPRGGLAASQPRCEHPD